MGNVLHSWIEGVNRPYGHATTQPPLSLAATLRRSTTAVGSEFDISCSVAISMISSYVYSFVGVKSSSRCDHFLICGQRKELELAWVESVTPTTAVIANERFSLGDRSKQLIPKTFV